MEISIIIPVYNAERYLRECLDSAISQTVKEKEVICIDDGSTDRSPEILGWYHKQYPYIKVLRQENRGPGEARNAGLKAAVGRYVSFLDADDFYIDPEALERMVRACESSRLPVCAGLRRVYRDGSARDFPLYRDCFAEGENAGGKVMAYMDYQDDYFYQNYIFSAKAIKENGIWFPPYRRYEDPPFFLAAMVSIEEYMVLPVEFYGYRDSAGAFSRKGMHLLDTLKGIRDNMETARENRLEKLKGILIHRIDSEYAPWIIGNADKEILEMLCGIQRTAFDGGRTEGDAEEREIALEIVRSIVAGVVKGNSLGAYFERQGLAEVAVYGLGAFGKMAVTELKKSKAITVYGIDQRVKEMDGIVACTLEEANARCREIIITPIKSNADMIRSVRKVWSGDVIGLYELAHKAEGEIGAFCRKADLCI